MRSKFKKALCLLLTILVLTSSLPISAMAASFGAGSGPSTGGGGGGSDTIWTPDTKMAGILVNVQSTPVTVNGPPDDQDRPQGYTDVLKYWCTHFPNTKPEDGIDGLYIIPKNAKNKLSGSQPAAAQWHGDNATSSYVTMGYNGSYMTTGKDYIVNWAGRNAYEAAISGVNEHNPSVHLDSGYWQAFIAKQRGNDNSKEDCLNIIVELFTPYDSNNGFIITSAADDINHQIACYLGTEFGSVNDPATLGIRDKDEKNVALFLNYCGFIATAIAAMKDPAARAPLAKQLDEMCQNYLNGEPYSPMVVTGEIVVGTEYKNSGKVCDVWWTPKQALSAVTKRAINEDISGYLTNYTSLKPIDAIGASCGNGWTSAPARTMYGVNKGGVGFQQSNGLAVRGRVIQSIDTAYLSGTNLKPIEGFGVWGAAEVSAPPPSTGGIPNTVDAATVTPQGEVSISVMDKMYVEESTAYAETLDVTVKVRLDGDMTETTTTYVDGLPVQEVVNKQEGAGISSCLKWLKNHDTTGTYKPVIRVYVKQADPVTALSNANSDRLVQDTWGYYGDGIESAPNDRGTSVSPTSIESSMTSFNWITPDLSQLVFQDKGVAGLQCSVTSTYIEIKITDYSDAIKCFESHDASLVFKGTINVNGNLQSETDTQQIWFKVGTDIKMGGPMSLTDMENLGWVKASLHCRGKYDYTTITAKPDTPYYYSTYKDPYSELKQGTVPITGTGSDEKFNSMTGTPTFTETHNQDCTGGQNPGAGRSDFIGTVYENAGHYYQYFASGGTEFVVQFDGEYVETANSSRTYTASFSKVNCESYVCSPDSHPNGKGGSYTDHCQCHHHTISDSFTWTQGVKGFSYVKIKNLKVWKLSEARLDGTRELLDTDEVYATVKSNAPEISYNIAGADTSSQGRLVYSFEPAQNDTVTIPGYPKNSSNSCSGWHSENQQTLDGDTASITCSATCVSDFIVLHTSNGDQSILYYEYKSKNDAAINKGNCVAEDIEFETVPYETVWTNNTKTSEGCKLPKDGITYGGYNGDYENVGTKYQSSGHDSNITWSDTAAYKNESRSFGTITNSALCTKDITQKFRLLNDELVIPDTKQNGEYIVGESEIFYENIVNYGPSNPHYPIVAQRDFNNQKGFVLSTTYSPAHQKINDEVVYNPVSNQNAIVVSLPDERDQRTIEHVPYTPVEDNSCPGDASCSFLQQDCSITQHLHTEDCFVEQSFTVHTPNNVHEHTDACGYVSSCDCSHCGNPNCPYYCSNHRYACSATCGIANGTGAMKYSCNNLPLNKHICDYVPSSGDLPNTGDSKDFSYTGGEQTITLGPGTYKLETWGAQGGKDGYGGSNTYKAGGLGGYSYGELTIADTTTLYINVGGEGTSTYTYTAAYNGGGKSDHGSGGGGATHIATASGVLSTLSSSKSAVLIVAGGGGGIDYGGSNVRPSGGGGGLEQPQPAYGQSQGATTSSGYAFGKGQDASASADTGAGGGGYFGGSIGVLANMRSYGGGGSAFLSASLANTGGSADTQSGNGKAKITRVNATPASPGDLPNVGDTKDFAYTGGEQTITLGPGTYNLEIWGAPGGDGHDGNSYYTNGGYGGIASGTLKLARTTTLYVYVGGEGGHGSNGAAGGFNGGGVSSTYGGGGGGATHIATMPGVLSSLSNHQSSILLVAGGGGGGFGFGSNGKGGSGGGTTGGDAYGSNSSSGGYGATQSAPGSSGNTGSVASFGKGGNSNSGGGGGFYGGGGGSIGGGGGSGYNGDAITNGILSNGSSYIVSKAKITKTANASNPNASSSGSGEMSTGDTKTLDYTGSVQTITLDAGTYEIQAFGAQGGRGYDGSYYDEGGQGGVASGTLKLTKRTTLFVYVGGKGGDGGQNVTTNGGFNGGGYSIAYGGGGGGATHIATVAGELKTLSSQQSSILLVAGGGGGNGGRSGRYGGAGGGTAGGDGFNGCGGKGYGATQSAAGASGRNGSAAGFGYGGNQTVWYSNGGAGGGGGFYGGGAGGNDATSYKDNDDSGGGGGSGYIGAQITNGVLSTGGNTGNGKVVIKAVSVNRLTCRNVNQAVLTCMDPHHAYSYNWKLYTFGLYHKSGVRCTGRDCTDTTNVIFPDDTERTLNQCASGYIVKHANGGVHLSTIGNGVCDFCGKTYNLILSRAQNYDRTVGADEWSHYDYGDSRCWAPCGNPDNHKSNVTQATLPGGRVVEMGSFINLDWPFEIYFPNTGDFYGTGRKASSTTSAERGWGYTNDMDTTEWVKAKWVEFPFAVVTNNTTYRAYERIYLSVPDTLFQFYVPLQDSEMASAEVRFGTIAINTQNGETIECGANKNHNIEEISYNGKPMAHHHNADKRTYIDVVGRIGSLTMEDTGDFRFSNFFKQPLANGWIVPDVVRKVNPAVQNNLVIDQVDVRGVELENTAKSPTNNSVWADTYGTKTERDTLGDAGKLHPFPLTPQMNNIAALRRQPVRLGYEALLDFETLGNYYGMTTVNEAGEAVNTLCLIKPHFYRMDINSGTLTPVDVYMQSDGQKVLINDFDSRTVAYQGKDSSRYFNWQDTYLRRNYNGLEQELSTLVAEEYEVPLPSGTSWFYGNYNILNLTTRNRTFIGSQNTYGWTKDPSEKLPDLRYSYQGARWHFGLSLPSSATFVLSGDAPTTENEKRCIPNANQYVIIGALEIYAQGDVWTLIYDGKTTNQPFRVTPTSPVVDPAPTYPNHPEEEMPIVCVFSPNHSSKEDMNTSGTH